jgi:5-methylthioadenosine/S-adenosylhomocysteine deaminase
MSIRKVDLLIKNGLVVTMDDQARVLPGYSVGISGDAILFIEPCEAGQETGAAEILDATGCAVMPGFVNCHTHAAMTLFRGFADDLSLKTWLTRYIWPAEARFINRRHVALGTRLALLEMIESGTVMFADMYFFEDEVAKACEEAGMRVLLGEGILDFPTPHLKTPGEEMDFNEELARRYHHHPLIRVAYAPHAIYTCAGEVLREIARRSDASGLPVHTHLAETRKEADDCFRQNNKTPVEYMHANGLLNDRLIAAHMVHLRESDIELLKEYRPRIAHNPSSNLKLASGFPDVTTLLQAGLTVGLGTDGAASNNNLSIPVELRQSAIVSKLTTGNPEAVNARQALYMATSQGAHALGAGDLTGSVEVGKKADIITIPLDKPHLQPVYNIFSLLAYSLHSADVDSVIINGRMVMRHRQHLTLDRDRILHEIKAVAGDIHKAFLANNKK